MLTVHYIHKTVFDYIYLKITHQIKERETTVNLLIFNFSLQNSTFFKFYLQYNKGKLFNKLPKTIKTNKI